VIPIHESELAGEVRSTVRSLLARHTGPAELGHGRVDRTLWRALAQDLGIFSIFTDPDLGPDDAAVVSAVVAEELGAHVAPVPYLSTLGCLTALRSCPERSAAAGLAAEITDTGCVAVPLVGLGGLDAAPAFTLSSAGELSGGLPYVVDAADAEFFLVPAAGPDGPVLCHVDRADPGVDTAPRLMLDATRGCAAVTLERASATVLATGSRADIAIGRLLATTGALLAWEQVGIIRWCLDEIATYGTQRIQFGRPIASFQAVKHRIADMFVLSRTARAVAKQASAAVAAGPDLDPRREVAIAQAYCSAAAVRAAEECLQLHGGIGMTWEHPAHLYLKRAKSDELWLGAPADQRDALGQLLGVDAA
jgi:alkylation response protein AidB-like acyl-CoA dehydrogenase